MYHQHWNPNGLDNFRKIYRHEGHSVEYRTLNLYSIVPSTMQGQYVQVILPRHVIRQHGRPCTLSPEGAVIGGIPVQGRARTAIGHFSIGLVQNLDIEVITTLKDDSPQYPSAVYLELS